GTGRTSHRTECERRSYVGVIASGNCQRASVAAGSLAGAARSAGGGKYSCRSLRCRRATGGFRQPGGYTRVAATTVSASAGPTSTAATGAASSADARGGHAGENGDYAQRERRGTQFDCVIDFQTRIHNDPLHSPS